MISGTELVAALKYSLSQAGVDYEGVVESFGQVAACQDRQLGKEFTFSEHVRGLVLSLLSNQRPWGPIAENLDQITELFEHWNEERLLQVEPKELVDGLRRMRCGNRQINAQMDALAPNIKKMRSIESDFGSLDQFVTHSDPDQIADGLATPGRYKLKQIGFALAMEYLRNVGVPAIKPDVHVCRVLGPSRLGYSNAELSPQQAYELLMQLSSDAGHNPTFVDNLLWMFCATDYADICGARPKCTLCCLASRCRYPNPVT